jgi:hypothetical protein
LIRLTALAKKTLNRRRQIDERWHAFDHQVAIFRCLSASRHDWLEMQTSKRANSGAMQRQSIGTKRLNLRPAGVFGTQTYLLRRIGMSDPVSSMT